MSNQPHQTIIIQNQGSSALGIAGLIFSILGWFTCGLLCIPGALLSFAGLFSSKPKGYAVAGLIVGFPGVLFFLFAGSAMLLSALGIGAAASQAVADAKTKMAQAQAQASQQITQPETVEEEAPQNVAAEQISTPDLAEAKPSPTETALPTETVPASQPEVKPMPETKPEPVAAPFEADRTFADATGKFKIDATVLAYKQGWLQLKRKDNGKTISIEVKKLSDADQNWVTENEEQLSKLGKK